MTEFRVLGVSYSVIRDLRGLVSTIRRRSFRLATQIEDAASSVALNLGEGNRRAGRDRAYHFRVAAGSAEEVRCGLHVAEAWGYLRESDTASALAQVDTLLAMIWGLNGGRRRSRTA